MSFWVVLFLMAAGLLFLMKMGVVLATGLSLPVTQGAVFVGSSHAEIQAFLDAVPMEPAGLLVDLGCGDGRVLRAAQERYGVRGLGLEVNPVAYMLARLRLLGKKGVRVRRCNFWDVSLREADVVYCYMFPDVLSSVAGKLQRELRPGAWVVSARFPFPAWSPGRVVKRSSPPHDPLYVYQVPEAFCHGPTKG